MAVQPAFAACLCLMAFCASCAPEDDAPPLDAIEEMDHMARAAAAVAGATRPEADRQDDLMRKPEEVLAFIAIEPGMTVFEMEAGRGYYTELFSALVGPDGVVYMQNPESFDEFLKDPVGNRLADGRLANVRLVKSTFDHLQAQDNSADIVTWMLGPHELYFTPSDGNSLGDVDATYAEVFRILKPGGTFIILDHAAAPGSPETTGDTVHRIDPAIVKGLAEAAGFELADESDILRNPNDDYAMSVFDPAIRRQTDRFLLKYKKPETMNEE